MAFIIKTDPDHYTEGAVVSFELPFMYGGEQISAGDEVFIWTNETRGGKGLEWRGRVSRVHLAVRHRHVSLDVVPHRRVRRRGFGNQNLAAHRDDAVGSPLGELARKLYRHALNKVAALSPAESDYLRRYFDEEDVQ